MSVDATRRSLVGLALVAAAGLGGPRSAFAGMAGAFVGQSGEPHKGRFCLGLLTTENLGELRGAVIDIRKATHYFRVLRSRSTDRYKVEFSKKILDYLAGQDATQFSAIEIALPSWPEPGAERNAMVDRMARELFLLAPSTAAIKMVDNNDASNFGHLYATSGQSAGRAFEYGLIGSDDLLQLASFLTGLVNSAGMNKAQSAKGLLLGHLKTRLEVGEVSARTLAKHPLFRVRQLKL